MKGRVLFGLLWSAVVVSACSDGDQDQGLCYPGEELQVDSVMLCVYEASVVIETGFRCPRERPNRYDYRDVIICSGKDDLSEQEQESAWQQYHQGADETGPDISPGWDLDRDAESGSLDSTDPFDMTPDWTSDSGSDTAAPDLVDGPCFTVTDEEGVDFGRQGIGQIHLRSMTLTNCSRTELVEVSSLAILEHPDRPGATSFTLMDVPGPQEPFTVGTGDDWTFNLGYQPAEYTVASHPELCEADPCEVTEGAILAITASADAIDQSIEVDLAGTGVESVCPVAVARARIHDTAYPWSTSLEVDAGTYLDLDGSQSHDPDGSLSAYHWTVQVPSPGTLAGGFIPNARVASPNFLLEYGGTYVFSLEVIDDVGLASCETSQVVVTSNPVDGFRISVTWDTADTDLDLHLLHPAASGWNQSPWDCYYSNRDPNWGESSRDDDPLLDIDDVDGYGPESIHLSSPEGTASEPVTYRVGVYYYSDHGHGPTDATVRIIIDGIERYTDTLDDMTGGSFWDVARITWPTQEIESIDQYFSQGFPPL
ncbi:MAG: hypothetical protein JW797_16135 [Bradymonadales bacterium]|nr:hypothetical protein [Bradymonadales bacterium]